MEKVPFNGWNNNVRLSNKEMELVVTCDVGPRIIRLGFIGKRNVFAEIRGQQGKSNEKEWMIRGGHRLWIAPEAKPWSYELDNVPIEVEQIKNGVRTVQPPGKLTGIQKTVEITLSPKRNEVTILHKLTNKGRKAVDVAPWALSVMAPGGKAIIPLPENIPHTKRLTHNQEWSIWGYTNFADPRWTFGSRYIFFRQDMTLGPNKLGIAHREGWVAYWLAGNLFVKRFPWIDGAKYPDGGVNFETFSNEEMLELESLGPVENLRPGKSVTHVEEWSLHKSVPECRTDSDAESYIKTKV